DEKIARRREKLLAEQNQKKQEALAKKEHYEATEEEDENEDIEDILEEEFLDEEEAEEEQEIDAVDRIKNEIAEKFESETDSLQGVEEELEKLLIPQIKINGGQKPHIVCYEIYSKLNSLVENRGSIFEKCYPISLPLAHKMLVFSYKFPSSFGQWDPIKLSEGDVIKPQQSNENTVFPVIHRQYIYFFSSKENKETFMKNPIKYIRQPKPKPAVPVKIAIVGPPKSGKTTVAKKFASVYGLLRLSMGDAIRLVLDSQPESELALMLKWHLHKGLTVPDELAIQALDVALMNHVCNTTGVVIDGYPVTRKQVNLLESARIIPVKIFELDMDAKEVFRRALLDKESTSRLPYPEHDSSQILAIKNSCYKQHIDAIRTYYKKEHQNWCVIDAFQSKWWIWKKVLQEVQLVVKEIQIYLERIKEGKAAGIADLCVTPEELRYRLGEFGQYCPVSLAEKGELVDCSVTSSLQFAAEFRGHYYKMASQEELDKFLSRPEVYVPPLAPHPLPPPDKLPKKLTAAEVKALFPISAEMQGYCPVTYLDGKQRYEALVPGNIEYAAKYQNKVYIFESEEKLLKFMRLPEKYWNLKLPHKLPPIKEPILLTALPLAGYLEQGVATSLIKALNEVGCLKPKFPFLSIKKTALLFVACHLKAHNPRSSEPARQRYRRKLARFMEHCQLVPYLGAAMAGPYREPRRRPLGLDGRLQAFLSLKDAGPGFV
ncbi:PREDICTED: adenylate kinase 9-like, partial [Phaethon lepturus]|uniref:adenylate kinase 9-like n=1 Tax=Phaethon lepturus TaxID=97097 RepID=UPI000530A399